MDYMSMPSACNKSITILVTCFVAFLVAVNISTSLFQFQFLEKALKNETESLVRKEAVPFWGYSNVSAIPEWEYYDYRSSSRVSPVRDLLKVYVYEHQHIPGPENLTTNELEEYAKVVFPFDSVIFKLFRSFPGRTYDPTEADIFVAPYAHWTHCIDLFQKRGGYIHSCGRMSAQEVKKIMDSFQFHSKQPDRHLWFNGDCNGNSHPYLMRRPLHVSTGPAENLKKENENSVDQRMLGDIIIPFFISSFSKQPSVLRSLDESWWSTRKRTYALSYIFGPANPRNTWDPRIYRRIFHAEVWANWNNSLGGMPTLVKTMAEAEKDGKRYNFKRLYEDSIFCPCLAGDLAVQKRFFDSIVSGCIPVVPEWTLQNGGISWFVPRENFALKQNTYPFWNRINYESFVVAVPVSGNDLGPIKPFLENLLKNETDLIRRRLEMRKVATLMTFGVGRDAHKYEDSFSQMMRDVKDYLNESFDDFQQA